MLPYLRGFPAGFSAGSVNLAAARPDLSIATMVRTGGHIYDELLMLRCQDGNRGAFEELVARWQQRLWRHAWHLTGNRDAAWDVLQEAWMAIVRGIRGLEDPARFRPWAYRIVTYKCADWVRRQQRERKLSQDVR